MSRDSTAIDWDVQTIPSREPRFGRRRQRWAVVFLGRQAQRRLEERLGRLRREILDYAAVSYPFMDAMKRRTPQ